jgi:imidazoleglycerol-phosphate dehydratase
MTRIRRETRETRVTLAVRKGAGPSKVNTDDQFLTHMVETLARYAGLEIELEAAGDLRHHLVEDVAITLGTAILDLVPPQAVRYGSATVPMDEALVLAAVDLGGRPYYVGPLPSALYEHFLQSMAVHLKASLHVRVMRGRDRHHVVEAAVKATGLALREALASGEEGGVFSTKGSVTLTRLPEKG